MDVWIVAAAAGAGYVAQRLKNLTKGCHNRSNSCSENLISVRSVSPAIINKPFDKNNRNSLAEEMYRDREQDFVDASTAETTSTSGFKGQNLVTWDSFPCWNAVNNEVELAGSQGRLPHDFDEVKDIDTLLHPFPVEIGFSYGCKPSKTSIRSRRIGSEFRKPLTSLESCLMTHLYNDRAELEEFTFSAPKKPILCPFLVTDGSRIISRPIPECCGKPARVGKVKLSKDNCAEDIKSVLGIPRLPNVASVESLAKPGNEGKQVVARSNVVKIINQNQNNAEGPVNSSVLFFLGLTTGISYSFLGNHQEIEKLRKSLKHTQNLVQDLQDELEMKDALIVKELAVVDDELLDLSNFAYVDVDDTHDLSHEPKMNLNEDNSNENAEEESFKKIEAELEAELDRLQSNMNSSMLEGIIPDGDELDPDLVLDIVEGELRTDCFSIRADSQDCAERETSSSSSPTPHSVHYPISPRLLSLKLHKVIQSRLQERIEELEAALEQCQSKIKTMESEQMLSLIKVPDYETGSSSNQESPTSRDGMQSMDQPVVINLSGEALAAYNEAYIEFAKLSESDEEGSDCQAIFPAEKPDFDLATNDSSLNGHAEQCCSSSDEHGSRNGSDDEMEMLLIKQLVEKARQGSPAVLKAKWALLSSDESILCHQELEK